MKKFGTLLSVFFLTVSTSFAGSLVLNKKTSTYDVEMAIDRNPPIVGDNQAEIVLKDLSGRRVTEAQVLVNYYMPPMPRMAPMNYTTLAKLKGGTYRATMHLIMDGPWVIALKITLGGKTSGAKFNINAR